MAESRAAARRFLRMRKKQTTPTSNRIRSPRPRPSPSPKPRRIVLDEVVPESGASCLSSSEPLLSDSSLSELPEFVSPSSPLPEDELADGFLYDDPHSIEVKFRNLAPEPPSCLFCTSPVPISHPPYTIITFPGNTAAAWPYT